MTTDYSKMSHQQLYDYVHSGDPQAMTETAAAWKKHAQDMQTAVNQLQTNLTAIQTDWQGAAADAYFQQSQNVATTMQTQADDASATSTAVTNTANALTWARNNMPSPPSWLEQKTADIDSNFITGAIGFFTTDGTATVASELAKHDIASKHQQAISVTTQLAGIYTSAQSQLPGGLAQYKDTSNGQSSNGNGAPSPTPVPIYPSGLPGMTGSGGAGSGKVPQYTPPASGTPIMATTPPGSGSGGTTIQGTGPGLLSTTPGTVPTPGGTGTDGGGGIGGAGGGGLGALGGLGGAGALNGFGGAGGIGDTDLGGGTGSGIGADDGGLGSTDDTGTGTSDDAAAAGAGAAGEGEEVESPMAMGMGGMGGGRGMGGSEEERGSRAAYLRQDKDYWYGDKNAAPPGGVIE